MTSIKSLEDTIKALNAIGYSATIRSLCITLKHYRDLMDKIDALVPEDERNSDWEEGGTIEGLYEYIKNLREEAAELPDEE
jgi:hypothetical protein